MKFITFREEDIKAMADDLNIGLRRINFLDNFNGEKKVLNGLKSGNVTISHSLKKVPSYRIILSQEGGTYITDVREEWTDKRIVLNLGADTTRLEIFIGV